MKRSTGIVLFLLLLGFGLRVWNLAGQSFWWDEAFTWQTTSHGLANFWQMLLTGDRNPPLYFVSVALWGSVAGWSEFSLRFVSVFWMMIGLAFLFNLAKRLYNASAGLWALALAAIAPALVVYAQEARMYAAFFALTTATLYFAWRVFEIGNSPSTRSAPAQPAVIASASQRSNLRANQRTSLVGSETASSHTALLAVTIGQLPFRIPKLTWAFLLCEASLLLTHYFAIPLVAALNFFALIILLRRRARFTAYARWIGGQILAALPMLIWTLIVFTTPGSLIKPQEAPPDIFAFIGQVVISWLSGVRDLNGAGWGLLFVALILLIVALMSAWRMNRRSMFALGLFGLITVVLAYLLTSLLTSFHPRYVLPYSIPWFMLLGGALSGLGEDVTYLKAAYQQHRIAISLRRARRKPIKTRSESGGKWLSVVAGLVTSVTVFLLSFILLRDGWQMALLPEYAKDDARDVAAYLKQYSADVVVLQEANDYTLNYYDHGLAQMKMITATNEAEALQQLSGAIGDAKRVWLPHWNVSTQDPRGYWPFLLEQSGQMTDWKSFQGYEVRGYEMHTPLHAPILTERSDSAAHVARRVSLADAAHPDGALAVAVEWQLPIKYYDSIKVSLRLLDATGRQIFSVDRPLLNELGQTTERWDTSQPVTNYYILPIPLFSPPGTYTVTGTLYNGRDVLAEDLLGTLQEPRYLYIGLYDPDRSLAGYQWETPPRDEDGSKLMLEKFAIGTSSPQPLAQVDIALIWLKPYTFDLSEYVAPRLRLVQNGRVWSEVDSELLTQRYPVAQWAISEAVLDRLTISYPPVRGPLELQVGQGDQWTTLMTLQLDESQMMFNPPSMQHAQSAQFGDFAELLGYDLKSDSLSSVRPLNLTLYWRATNTEPITTSYTVFTQILAPDGHLVAQDDAPPHPPTTAWVSGQIVDDYHWIKVVDPAYRGPATLIVGWYNSTSVERVPVNGGGDYVSLTAPVRVEEK